MTLVRYHVGGLKPNAPAQNRAEEIAPTGYTRWDESGGVIEQRALTTTESDAVAANNAGLAADTARVQREERLRAIADTLGVGNGLSGDELVAAITEKAAETVSAHTQTLAAHAAQIGAVAPIDTSTLPTLGQKNALSGTQGTPGLLNQYVTQQDPRNSDARTPTAHSHAYADITAKPSTFAPSAHTHGWAEVTGKPATFPSETHSHDDRYYTEAETDARIAAAGGGGANRVRINADVSNTLITLADATGLSIPVLANTDYTFDFTVAFQTAATTTGIQLALNGPASPTLFTAVIRIPSSATAFSTQYVSAYNTGPLTTAIDAANTPRIAEIKGILRNGPTAGNLTVRFRTEIALSTVTIKAGSSVGWH